MYYHIELVLPQGSLFLIRNGSLESVKGEAEVELISRGFPKCNYKLYEVSQTLVFEKRIEE